MATAYQCDQCGKLIKTRFSEKAKSIRNIRIICYFKLYNNGNKEADLCAECMKEVLLAMKED